MVFTPVLRDSSPSPTRRRSLSPRRKSQSRRSSSRSPRRSRSPSHKKRARSPRPFHSRDNRDDRENRYKRHRARDDRDSRDRFGDRDGRRYNRDDRGRNWAKRDTDLAGPEFLEHRRKMRAEKSCSPVWARSPSPPKQAAKRKRDEIRESDSSNSSSESDSSRERKSKRRKKNSSRSHKKRKKSSKSSKSSKKRKLDSDDKVMQDSDDDEDQWTEKQTSGNKGFVGPVPLPQVQVEGYGGAMLPGEAEAYAKFVQENKRIPRRGEVGLSSNEIERFEDLGYVMSGSRHRKMNAVRIRKENQIYSAEEKRALAMFNYEEKAKRENQILADFRDIVATKLVAKKK
eukprot:TRINITY_DN5638_c0_g1_i1.p1 TRINITY_DN5638_c0_g1~~TRINITY_DN5638_c0_g1_i1.p1  ORF type:complete len:343 (+),score=68.81 TRINITY_DN5638_c0_g1_i1:108-1136(+)